MGEVSGLKTVIDQIPLLSDPGEVAECLAWLEASIGSDARAEIDYGEFGPFIHMGEDPRLLRHAHEIAQLWLGWYTAHKDRLEYDVERSQWTLHVDQ